MNCENSNNVILCKKYTCYLQCISYCVCMLFLIVRNISVLSRMQENLYHISFNLLFKNKCVFTVLKIKPDVLTIYRTISNMYVFKYPAHRSAQNLQQNCLSMFKYIHFFFFGCTSASLVSASVYIRLK